MQRQTCVIGFAVVLLTATMAGAHGLPCPGSPCTLYSSGGCTLQAVGRELTVTGCNFNIKNGAGGTGSVNSFGSLVIGYNEDAAPANNRSGSHNLVIGPDHTYSSYGGLVAGNSNTVSGANASVSGGFNNVASGNQASVSGGWFNTAQGPFGSVSGGASNVAMGVLASVSGGSENHADNTFASVTGGSLNTASGPASSVGGGEQNEAIELGTSIIGGSHNTADGIGAVVTGGSMNFASHHSSIVLGGEGNFTASDLEIVPFPTCECR